MSFYFEDNNFLHLLSILGNPQLFLRILRVCLFVCFNKFIYLLYFWLYWVFIAACGLSLVAASGATLRCGARASHCGGFSLLWSMGSRCADFSSCGSRALECRLTSCGARALLLRGMWDLPVPGIEPVLPALAGRWQADS